MVLPGDPRLTGLANWFCPVSNEDMPNELKGLTVPVPSDERVVVDLLRGPRIEEAIEAPRWGKVGCCSRSGVDTTLR